ncbi:transglycosylase domain-containing protein [Nocardioides sp.]|uniref:transglycosylase domain-containing protein n=1 Tax=Nocardioides sp. TaxID=35761 RepID=UPI002630A9FC|nr:transglycosylase domain-containing protein [Nocardioides sp.]
MAAVAVVLGVVVALLAIPLAGVAGIGARNVARGIGQLPTELETGELSQRSKIVDAEGRVITTLYDENRITRPLNQISRTMVQAIVSIEDYRFYQHGALDLKGTLRAFITNQANSGTVQGGSSITQQLVKLTLLGQAKTDAERKEVTADSYSRKIKELRYAIALEQAHSKDWILERYLNTAYFGDGAYGIQAAAKHYFNVNSDKITLTQAAVLAGLVKNPTGYDPTNAPDRAIARRNVVLDRMAQLNVISAADAATAKKAPLGLDVQKARNGCVNSSAPFFCDYVLRRLLADPALGQTVEDRRKLLNSGGLTIKTTLNLDNQRAADKSVAAHVYATDQALGAIAEVEPGTGNVLALAQSRPMGSNKKKGQTYLNYTVPKEYGDANGFQAGSTFKAFTLAVALRDGVGLNTSINSPSPMTFPQSAYANCPGSPAFGGEWKVGNSTTSDRMTLYTGTRLSVNTFFAQLEQVTGVCEPFKLAKSMGLFLTDPTHERQPSFTLGVVDVSPLEMAGAYATFAARGLHCDARPVTAILDSAGNTIKKYPTSCTQVLPNDVADGVNDVLRGVQEPGGFGYNLGHTNLQTSNGTVIPSAGKTGTTQSAKSVWFMGYTPQIATAAMIAGANSSGTPIPLGGVSIAGTTAHATNGSGFAGPMWADAMHPIQNSLQPENFTAPPASMQPATPDMLKNIKILSQPVVKSATPAKKNDKKKNNGGGNNKGRGNGNGNGNGNGGGNGH